MALIPMVIEESPRGERSFDIYSRLLLLFLLLLCFLFLAYSEANTILLKPRKNAVKCSVIAKYMK